MRKLGVLAGSIVTLAVVLLTPLAKAQTVNDFVVNDFHGRYELFNDTNGGRMQVLEKLDITYSGSNHGILRAIPGEYKNQKLQMKIQRVLRNGVNENYTTYRDNDNEVIKIGNADQTVTGNHIYEIGYELTNVISFYDAHDEWYWDINGDDWDQPFTAVSGEVIFPDEWTDQGVPVAKCFTGSFGSSSVDCAIQRTARGYSFSTKNILSANETLTIVAAAPKELFKPRTAADWLKQYWPIIAGTIIPPFLIGGWAYRRWAKNGKDLKGRGTIIPEYGPPKNLSPAEAAVISNYGLNAKDVSATIIDLAIRKYIRIHEATKKKILKDKKEYELELTNDDWSKLKNHEQKILKDIFQDQELGKRVELESLKNKFYKTIQDMQASLPKELTHAGYFTSNPRTAGSLMYGLGIALVVIGFILLALLPGIVIGGVLVLVFAALMPKRSAEGQAVKEAMAGLKLYMNVAEKERIKMLQSPDAPYAAKSNEPQKTVELFEKLLPFAIIMGVEKGWAEQFKDIYTSPPDWYAGSSWSSFNTGVLIGSLNNSVSAMGSSFSAPSSSGGSGLSGGGGFSGGGGGGGGGGGW